MSIVEDYRQILKEVRTNLRSIEEPNPGDEFINDSLRIIDKVLLDEQVTEKSLVLALENIELESKSERKSIWIRGTEGYINLEELIAESVGEFDGRATIEISIQEVGLGVKVVKNTWPKVKNPINVEDKEE